MSTELEDSAEMSTQPTEHHMWLQKLVGEWKIESEIVMAPGEPTLKSEGTASVTSLGGLWAYSESNEAMPNETPMLSRFALGYDVTFKEYRGCLFCSASSHLWKYVGELSEDGQVMTLNCEGPSMTEEEGTALYRDVIQFVDDNHRIHFSYSQDANGEWREYMKAHYSRI